ncbi:FadR family transcriptional regulator [Bacillus infantis]|uniref:FadR family transcriptional regulator n=2 Tax=Bacillus infantis TaxID=324767 RepID=A0A5D4R678_9BACI|nr:FadR family transcriptional regulator [Bacillus infantis]
MSEGSKVYVEIVKELRSMIQEDGLKPGDKLPSERELTERLNVGRSSVREALRALELLGLIETRRGEGTFIRDFRGHQLVQLLSTFILQDERSKHDVRETKYLIEMDCLWLVMRKAEDAQLLELRKWVDSSAFADDDFFYKIVSLADNHLFIRMWLILKDYYNSLHLQGADARLEEYTNLIDALSTRKESEVRRVYRDLRKLSIQR